MKRFTIGATALVLALAVVTTAAAAGKGSSGGSSGNGMGGKSSGGSGNGQPHYIQQNGSQNSIRSLDLKGNQFKQTVQPKFTQTNVNKNVTMSSMKQIKATYAKNDYHVQFGQKQSFGYCYQGKSHCHWTYSCYCPAYQCNCCWCPCVCAYYYFCVPDNCWYPITYCPYGVYTW